MSSWHSPQSIFSLGHRALTPLLDNPVVVEEKVDGSFIAFGVYETVESGPVDGSNPVIRTTTLKMRSKGADLYEGAPGSGMFNRAIETIKTLAPNLHPGWQYRGEYLMKPKHNALAYDRVPDGHIIIFDILSSEEMYLSPVEKRAEAARLGLECVPVLFAGVHPTGDEGLACFTKYLDTVSVLGGQKIEGVVIKNYSQYGPDKKALFGKHVSEAYREVQRGEWKKDNPTSGDILERIVAAYRTPARWEKAVQHLTEAGKLDGTPKDIGLLMREVPADTFKECEEDLLAEIMKWARPHIQRGVTRGLPEWYKAKLAERQFSG